MSAIDRILIDAWEHASSEVKERLAREVLATDDVTPHDEAIIEAVVEYCGRGYRELCQTYFATQRASGV